MPSKDYYDSFRRSSLSDSSDILSTTFPFLDVLRSPFASYELGVVGMSKSDKNPLSSDDGLRSRVDSTKASQETGGSSSGLESSSDTKGQGNNSEDLYPFLSKPLNEEDMLKILASKDSLSDLRRESSLLLPPQLCVSDQGGETTMSLRRNSSDSFLSRDSLTNVLKSMDWVLKMSQVYNQMAQPDENLQQQPSTTTTTAAPPQKRTPSDAFSSKESLSKFLAPLNRTPSDAFSSKESLSKMLASGDPDFLKWLSVCGRESSLSGGVLSSKDTLSRMLASTDATRRLSTSSSRSLDGLRRPGNLDRSRSDTFSSMESLSKAFPTSDLALLMGADLASLVGLGPRPTEDGKPGGGIKRSFSDAFLSKERLNAAGGKNFDSKDWTKEYQRGHIDIAPKEVFEAEKKARRGDRTTEEAATTTPPPTVKAQKNNSTSSSSWLAGYYQNIKEAAQPKGKKPTTTKKATTKKSSTTTTKGATTKTRSPKDETKTQQQQLSSRHSRREPEVKIFFEPTDKDVLFGRGGKSNNHPGNKIYREELERLKPVYKLRDKNEKTELAQLLIDTIKNKFGGRFLQKDDDNRFFEVSNVVARRKASQALREENTSKSRQEKRAKYQKS